MVQVRVFLLGCWHLQEHYAELKTWLEAVIPGIQVLGPADFCLKWGEDPMKADEATRGRFISEVDLILADSCTDGGPTFEAAKSYPGLIVRVVSGCFQSNSFGKWPQGYYYDAASAVRLARFLRARELGQLGELPVEDPHP